MKRETERVWQGKFPLADTHNRTRLYGTCTLELSNTLLTIDKMKSYPSALKRLEGKSPRARFTQFRDPRGAGMRGVLLHTPADYIVKNTC